MKETSLLISKTIEVDNPISFTQWCRTYKVGSRIPKMRPDIDMYTRGDYDIEKLVKMLNKEKSKKWYDRFIKG